MLVGGGDSKTHFDDVWELAGSTASDTWSRFWRANWARVQWLAVMGVVSGLVLFAVVAASAIVSLIPALRAYRLSPADGMMVRT